MTNDEMVAVSEIVILTFMFNIIKGSFDIKIKKPSIDIKRQVKLQIRCYFGFNLDFDYTSTLIYMIILSNEPHN